MLSQEIKKERELCYKDLCSYLKQKYGNVNGDYFITTSCKTKNNSIMRGYEGLFVHHIMESHSADLSKYDSAIHFPFEYQKANNLLYCNYIEHLLLHLNIVKEFFKAKHIRETQSLVGIGGIINHIVPEINDYYGGYEYVREWQKTAFSLIANNLQDYLDILKEIELLLDSKKVWQNLVESGCGEYGFTRSLIDFNKRPYKGKMFSDTIFTKEYLLYTRNDDFNVTSLLKRIDKSKYFNIIKHKNYYIFIGRFLNNLKSVALYPDEEIELMNYISNNYKLVLGEYCPKSTIISYQKDLTKEYKIPKYYITFDGKVRDKTHYSRRELAKILNIDIKKIK